MRLRKYCTMHTESLKPPVGSCKKSCPQCTAVRPIMPRYFMSFPLTPSDQYGQQSGFHHLTGILGLGVLQSTQFGTSRLLTAYLRLASFLSSSLPPTTLPLPSKPQWISSAIELQHASARAPHTLVLIRKVGAACFEVSRISMFSPSE